MLKHERIQEPIASDEIKAIMEADTCTVVMQLCDKDGNVIPSEGFDIKNHKVPIEGEPDKEMLTIRLRYVDNTGMKSVRGFMLTKATEQFIDDLINGMESNTMPKQLLEMSQQMMANILYDMPIGMFLSLCEDAFTQQVSPMEIIMDSMKTQVINELKEKSKSEDGEVGQPTQH